MATIRTRKQSDGTIRYCAVVRIRKGKTIIHQEYCGARQKESGSAREDESGAVTG
jgi:hypothetical protein